MPRNLQFQPITMKSLCFLLVVGLASAQFPFCPNPLVVTPVPSRLSQFTPWFNKHVNVFGCNIFSDVNTTVTQTLWAANILAQIIDNDEDGVPDYLPFLTSMQDARATVPIFYEDDTPQERDFSRNGPRGYATIGLYGDEIFTRFPGEPQLRRYDATFEEIFHLYTSEALIEVFPAIFDDDANSGSIASQTMELMIDDCGYAFNNTYNWPGCNGVYHYNDRTCSYRCLVVEYEWWMMSSVLGFNDPAMDIGPVGRCHDISDEWELCSSLQVQRRNPGFYEHFTNPVGYQMPRVNPDGLYCVGRDTKPLKS